jgi:hypothetical protein
MRSMQFASLREDYLNQVQRDFLSRRCKFAVPTPLAKWHTHQGMPVAIVNEVR